MNEITKPAAHSGVGVDALVMPVLYVGQLLIEREPYPPKSLPQVMRITHVFQAVAHHDKGGWMTHAAAQHLYKVVPPKPLLFV